MFIRGSTAFSRFNGFQASLRDALLRLFTVGSSPRLPSHGRSATRTPSHCREPFRHTSGHLPTVGNPSDVPLNTSPPSAEGSFSCGSPAAGRREPRETANAPTSTVAKTSPSWPPAEHAPASGTARVAAPLSEPLELTDAPKKAPEHPLYYPELGVEFRPIPKGLCPAAQGCEVGQSGSARATLGVV